MRKLLYLLIFLIIALLLPQFSWGIGQMTKPIIIEDVMRSQEFIETLILFNSEDQEETYQLIAEGDIANWTSFYQIKDRDLENPITEIKIPGKSKLEALAKFTIPEYAPNGEYSGEVIVASKPEKETESDQTKVTVLQRVGREVLITVTDKEIINFDTTIIPLKYDVKKNEPLEIKIIYDNQGNISIKPDVQLTIIQKSDKIFNAIFPYPETEEAVRPRERKIMPLIEWQSSGLEDGTYRAEVKILLNGEVMEEGDFRFTIGYKKNWVLAAVSFIGFGSLVAGWFVLAGILVIIAGVLIFINRINKSKNSKFLQKGFINLFSFKNRKRRNNS